MTVYTDPKKLQKDLNKELEKIAKYFDGSHHAKLGILGGDSERPAEEGEDITNSELGLVHEFGSVKRNIVMRSWLRMPIMEKAKDIIKAIVKRKREIEKEAVRGEKPTELYNHLGLAGESAVQEAFDTGGFGTWEAKKPTKQNKDKMSPLIMTSQLRKSVSSKVEESK